MQMAYSGPESCFVFVAFTFKIKVLIILKIIERMKLSVNEAKLTGLWARNCATIQQVWISLPSGQKSFRAFRETGPWCDSNSVRHFSKCRSSYPACTRPLFRQLFRLITLYIALC